jgi:carbon-monoxide dehydrogenase medium subunit
LEVKKGMPTFTYTKCTDLSEAIGILGTQKQVYPFAGGTDIMVGIRSGKLKIKELLDIKDIPEFNILHENEDGITIGASVSLNEVVMFAPVQDNVPILAEACHSVGTYSIRNRGTLVGNICNGSPAADTAAPLYCLGAKVNIVGTEGSRTVTIEDFFVGPGQTDLKRGELVVSVLIPKPYPTGKGVFKKASRTGSVDLATVGVTVQRWQNEVRIALGSVAPTPVRAKSVERAVNVEKVTNFAEAAKLVTNDIIPITDLRGSREYRYHLAEVLVRRGLEETMEV